MVSFHFLLRCQKLLAECRFKLVLLRFRSQKAAAVFYSVVSRDSLDADYAAHRQRFLAEQGYGYIITDADDLLGPAI